MDYRKIFFFILLFFNLSFAENIKWYSYNEGLKIAREKNKLILIDIYAQWCHWCNVLKNTTYKDKEVIKIVKKYYIPVHIDAEKDVELNKKYNQGGLPTTLILTPNEEVVFGYARYIPPDKMKKILLKYANLSPEEIKSYIQARKKKENRKIKRIIRKLNEKRINYKIILKTFNYVKFKFDKNLGGYRGSPKFPLYNLGYFLMMHSIFDDDKTKEMLIKTADGYGKLIDKVEGGIFRYSTNAYWTEPHYEKLLRDQANLSLFFFNVYSYTESEKYLNYANSLIKFSKNKLLNKKDGYFFNSQGADIVDENGNLLLTGEEFFILNERERNKIVKKLGYAPKIEKSIYFSSNSLIARALLYSYIYNNNFEDKELALNLIDKINKDGFTEKGIKYSKNIDKYFLDTQVYYLEALLTAYQITGNDKYLNRALKLAEIIRKNYKSKLGIYTDLNDINLNPNRISFIDDLFTLNYRLAKAFYKLYIFTNREIYLNEMKSIIKKLPNKATPVIALAYYLYLKPPIAMHIVGKNKSKLINKSFKILPYWVFPHFIEFKNKKKIEMLGYKLPKETTIFVCNSSICFKALKEKDIKREIFFILKNFYQHLEDMN